MSESRRKSNPLVGTKSSRDGRSEPRLSLDSRTLTEQLEANKRRFDALAGEVQNKINEVKEHRMRYSPRNSPRTSPRKTTPSDDRKERDDESSSPKKPRSPARRSPRRAPAPVPAPISAPIPGGRPPAPIPTHGPRTLAPIPGPAPIPAPIPTMPAVPAPIPPMGAPAPIPAPLIPGMAPMPLVPGIAPMPGMAPPPWLGMPPPPTARKPKDKQFSRLFKRLQRHRGRFLRCVLLTHGFVRLHCDPPENLSHRIIVDFITVYNGLDYRVWRQRPAVPMRPLFWHKLKDRHALKSKFWTEVVEDTRFIDSTKLVDKFRKIEYQAPERRERKQEEKEEEPRLHVPHRKLVVLAVMTKLTRLTSDELLHYIRRMEDNAEGNINPRELLSLAPTDAEIQSARQDVADLGGDLSELTDAERFWWELCCIPKLRIRLENWVFMLEFEEEFELHEEQLTKVEAATACIVESERLKVFFGAVLAVGNYLNDDTKRGNAQAVALNVLNALEGMREGGSRETLLSYLYEVFEERAPDVLELADDLAPIHGVEHFDWDVLDECAVMGRALQDQEWRFNNEFPDAQEYLRRRQMDDEKERVVEEYAADYAVEDVAPVEDDEENGPFFLKIGGFLDEYRTKCQEMADRYNRAMVRVAELKAEFWEQRSEPQDFFWQWLAFLDAWERTRAAILTRRRLEELQRQREELKKLRREERRRRREYLIALGDTGEAWTYRQRFRLNKAQFQHCNSGFFLSYLQKNFEEYGTLEFDEESGTLLVVVDDGQMTPEGMEIIKTYLGKLEPVEEE